MSSLQEFLEKRYVRIETVSCPVPTLARTPLWASSCCSRGRERDESSSGSPRCGTRTWKNKHVVPKNEMNKKNFKFEQFTLEDSSPWSLGPGRSSSWLIARLPRPSRSAWQSRRRPSQQRRQAKRSEIVWIFFKLRGAIFVGNCKKSITCPSGFVVLLYMVGLGPGITLFLGKRKKGISFQRNYPVRCTRGEKVSSSKNSQTFSRVFLIHRSRDRQKSLQ